MQGETARRKIGRLLKRDWNVNVQRIHAANTEGTVASCLKTGLFEMSGFLDSGIFERDRTQLVTGDNWHYDSDTFAPVGFRH